MPPHNGVEQRTADTAPADRATKWSVWYVLGFVFGLAAVIGSIGAAKYGWLDYWDRVILHVANAWPKGLRGVFVLASLAPVALWLSVAGVVMAFLFRMYHLAWRLAAATVLGVGLVAVIDRVAAAPEPSALLTDLHLRVDAADTFPSMHVMIMTVSMLSVMPYLSRPWRAVVLVPIASMAVSRLYLGAETPLAVVCGAAIGLLVVCLLHVLPGGIRRGLRFE